MSLEAIYASGRQPNDLKNGKKMTVVWVDGCFDMMHYGHANALRQAREMGDFLVVGVHSDEEIRKHKGPPVMTEQERYAMVAACKWVDVVVPRAPYFTSLPVMETFHADFCVHGDDLTTLADGTDCYLEVKRANRYKEVKRTAGISTTELVGRMLLMTRSNHVDYHAATHSLTTSSRIVQFSEGREPKATDRVVFVAGDYDLFHLGHIQRLEAAKKLGDYLLVGVYDDSSVNQVLGTNFPLMSVHERALSVLSCRYVDEVVIGCPLVITAELLDAFKVKTVVRFPQGNDKWYSEAESRKILVTLSIPESLTADNILWRIIEQRKEYEERNRKKLNKV